MASTVWALLLILSSACIGIAGGDKDGHPSNMIKLGSSLSPSSKPPSWSSASGRFSFGFYRQGNGFSVAIWLDGNGGATKNVNKVVWTANRGDPPFSWNATLTLNEKGLLLSTTTEGGEEKVIANSSTDSASYASMLDSGNFVLYNNQNHSIWESFEHPTDTILGGQNLFTDHQLISSFSENNHSIGRFYLIMQGDGNLVMYPVGTGNSPVDAYWAWSSTHYDVSNKFHLYLNSTIGQLQLINNSDFSIIRTISKDNVPDGSYYDDETDRYNNSRSVYSASIDVDGNFRLYVHQFQPNGGGFLTYTRFKALKNSCQVKGFCGFNSLCTFNDLEPYCVCVPGTDFIDPYQNTLGCKRNYSEAGCMENEQFYHISPIEDINLFTTCTSYSKEKMSKDECSRTCLKDCNCEAALFKDGVCKKQKLPLKYLERDSDKGFTVFLKVGVRDLVVEEKPKTTMPIKRKKLMVEILVLTFSLVACSCVLLIVSGFFVYKFQVIRYERLLENGNLGLTEDLTLIIFSYHDLKKATNGFKEELGKGSFGKVYKGTLYKGRKLIAVKRLEKLMEEGEREFQAEMKAIGRTHHRNLVHLLGYCAEDSKRLLVYEYMANGSLADLLFKSTWRPDWNERLRIALDVARGVLYLHEECETPIIHCDIKPQNILMDDSWTAKISDFGLAKFLMGDQTRTFTGARGTRGYMAPEWQRNTPISVKADIFSFGIVLLEIVFCRRNLDPRVSKLEEIVLSTWVYRCFVEKELDKLVIGEEVDMKSLEKMVMVSLWCIQDEPALRPSMKAVVMMLEGITDIPIPPCPTASSM